MWCVSDLVLINEDSLGSYSRPDQRIKNQEMEIPPRERMSRKDCLAGRAGCCFVGVSDSVCVYRCLAKMWCCIILNYTTESLSLSTFYCR